MPQDLFQNRRLENCVASATTTAAGGSATHFSRLSMLTSAPPPPLHPAAATGSIAFSASRPILPPLARIQTLTTPGTPASIPSIPLLSHGEGGGGFHTSPSSYAGTSSHGPTSIPVLHRLSTEPASHVSTSLQSGLPSQVHPSQPARGPPDHSLAPTLRFHNPLKRGLEQSEAIPDRSASYESPGYGGQIDHNDRRLHSGTPSSAISYPTFGQPTFSSRRQGSSSKPPITSRCLLHIRQQPRAARAGPDGKDRRPIDPPPVVQLLMTDFDPDDPAEVEELQNSYYVVHCRLVSANYPTRDVSTLASTTEDGSKEVQRLLLGSAVSSPHHTKDDPNPSTMPCHPVSKTPTGPPSPTMRFITLPSSSTRAPPPPPRERPASEMPSTFFIFADLSVRKAGEYRLEFNLMKVEADKLVPGASMPILHTVASQVFKVVNAKDFDQVQPSTKLVKGLIERGAGFPLKLKKGTREGQRRKHQDSSNKTEVEGSHDGSELEDYGGGED